MLSVQVPFMLQPLVWFWQGKSHGHNQKGVHFVWLTEMKGRPGTTQSADLFPFLSLSRAHLQDKAVRRGSRAIPKPNSSEVTAPELQLGPAGQGAWSFSDQQVYFLPTPPQHRDDYICTHSHTHIVVLCATMVAKRKQD